jgi:dnd system-associated protein 4
MRRVQRDATKEDLIQQLCDSKTGYFSEIWRLLLFAALLGRAKGRREPLKKVDTGKGIDERIFANSPVWLGIVHLFGLIETGSSEALKSANWEKSLEVFEEYANGGLSIINDVGAEALHQLIQNENSESSRPATSDISRIRI